MDREANTILQNTSSNLKLSIHHETDHTKSWRTHEETELLHHRWSMKRHSYCGKVHWPFLKSMRMYDTITHSHSTLYTYPERKKNCLHRLAFKYLWYHPNSQKQYYFSQSQNRPDKANLSPNTVDSATNRKQLLTHSATQMKDVRNRRYMLYNSSGIKHLGPDGGGARL